MTDIRELYTHQLKRDILTITAVVTAPATSVQVSANHNLGRLPDGFSTVGTTVAGVGAGATDDEREKWTKSTWVGHVNGTATVKVEVF